MIGHGDIPSVDFATCYCFYTFPMNMNASKDYYAVLGVLPSAEDFVIRAVYKVLAQRYHPDRNASSGDEAHRIMAEINEAYEVISNPIKRKEYADLRGSAPTGDAEGFFDDASIDDSVNQSIMRDWSIACKYNPDLETHEKRLAKISNRLAFTFKLNLLGSREYSSMQKIALEMEREFLQVYFGSNPEIIAFAKSLIFMGNRAAAKELNDAVRVLGSSAEATSIISRIREEFDIFSPAAEDSLLQSVLEGNWESANRLLQQERMQVGAIRDSDGRSLLEITQQRRDKPMELLLSPYFSGFI